jgi:hypothetical protein
MRSKVTTLPPIGVGRFERCGDLREHAGALRVECFARREHASDEEKFRRLDASDVRILAKRLAERLDVLDL